MWSLIHSALKSEYFKAAVSKCVELQWARVGIEKADVSHNSSTCLGDAASLFISKVIPECWLPGKPAGGAPSLTCSRWSL